MTDPNDPARLDRLLARGKTSGPERDRRLENILAEHPTGVPSRWRSPRLWASGGAALAVAAGVALFVRQSDDGFREKGGQAEAVAGVAVACLDGNSTRCARGGTLVFRVEPTSAPGFLSAYAVRSDAGAGERIWYFPSKDGASLEVPASASPRAASRGVTLGAEHAEGRYVIHVLVTKDPLTREAALHTEAGAGGRPVLARGTTSIEITP